MKLVTTFWIRLNTQPKMVLFCTNQIWQMICLLEAELFWTKLWNIILNILLLFLNVRNKHVSEKKNDLKSHSILFASLVHIRHLFEIYKSLKTFALCRPNKIILQRSIYQIWLRYYFHLRSSWISCIMNCINVFLQIPFLRKNTSTWVTFVIFLTIVNYTIIFLQASCFWKCPATNVTFMIFLTNMNCVKCVSSNLLLE